MAKVTRLNESDMEFKLAADGIDEQLEALAIAVQARERAEEHLKDWKAENVDPVVATERAIREGLQAYMIENGLKTLKGSAVTLTVVERHDYAMEDESAFKLGLTKHGMTQAEYRVWDMPGIKKMASAFRKKHGEDFPGIVSTLVQFTQARLG